MGRHISGEVLSAFADGELTVSEARGAREHVRECGDCAAAVAAYGAFDREAAGPLADCRAVASLVSAAADDELTAGEAALLAPHLAACAGCRTNAAAWTGVDARVSALPARLPSARVDAAIHALGDRASQRRGRIPALARSTAGLAVAALFAIWVVGGTATPLGAGAASVFDPRTNTLYVLHPDQGIVAAVDATTHASLAVIKVGGRPTALALSESGDTIFVLDASQKLVTEIDAGRKSVSSTKTLVIDGTPTAIQAAPNGRLVVTAVASPAPAETSSTTGTVVVIDGNGALESTRTVAIAPRSVVLDSSGERALLLSSETTSVVDGATYRELGQLPGGVSAAFASRGRAIAVLSARADGSVVTIADATESTVTLAGAPRAIISLPQGGFAALVDAAGGGAIVEISADAVVRSTTPVALSGSELAYDVGARRYAVAGPQGVAYAAGGSLALASAPPSTPAPSPSPARTTAPSAAPSAIPSAVPSASAAPSAAAPAVAIRPTVPVAERVTPASRPLPDGVPTGSTLAWAGTYRYEVEEVARPGIVARSGSKLWFVDRTNHIRTLDTRTGGIYTIAALSADVQIRSLHVGTRYAYAVDGTAGTVYVIALPSEKLTTMQLPFVRTTAAVTVTPDDRLWFAVSSSGQVLTLDPATGRIEAAAVGFDDASALTADLAGRLWYADESRRTVGMYDPAQQRLTEVPLTRAGAVSALLVDGRGTLWVGTASGELIGVRDGAVQRRRDVGGAVTALALGPDGAAWFLATGRSGSFGPADGGAAQVGPRSLSGLWIDRQGHAWLADGATPSFYVSVGAQE